MSLFVSGKMGWDSMDRAAGDCVNAGVGGSLVEDVGAVDTGGVLPRDRSWAYDTSQYTITQHSLKLSMHKIERPSVTKCWSSGPHDTRSLLCVDVLDAVTYCGNRSKTIIALINACWQVGLDTSPTWIASIASTSLVLVAKDWSECPARSAYLSFLCRHCSHERAARRRFLGLGSSS
jgi:hypothetical protein